MPLKVVNQSLGLGLVNRSTQISYNLKTTNTILVYEVAGCQLNGRASTLYNVEDWWFDSTVSSQILS